MMEIIIKRINKKYLLSTLFICFWSLCAFAQETCELRFTTCPEDFNGDTLYVPPQVVALSSSVFTCDPAEVIEGFSSTSSPPSIVFIIDHSYSMMGLGNTWPGNDVDGSRFTVTRDLIDTIYKLHPDAEIGLVVFREVLYFDHRNNNLLVKLEGQGDQSYMPLLQLNQNVGKDMTGLDALDQILKTKTLRGYNEQFNDSVTCVDLVYEPKFSTIGNTNINNAMAAALQAMASAKNPPERQFFIFLSDGEPFPTTPSSRYPDINSWHGGKDPYFFETAKTNPTTFTVFFVNNDTIPPASLVTMTSNVRRNGYSSSNVNSNLWTLQTDYSALMSLIMKRVIKPIMTVTSGTATSMIINNVISTQIGDSGFIFSQRFPLNQGSTRFDMKINYHLKNNNDGTEKDTSSNIQFHVIRKDGAEIPDGVTTYCYQKERLSLYYNGQQVYVVNETMETLEIRFDPDDQIFQSVEVEVTNAMGQNRDLENIRLINNKTYWSKPFLRKIEPAVRGDNVLQHLYEDSIIVVYRNPEIPLDTIRIAVPFISGKSIAITAASYNDKNADGFIDSIYLKVEGAFNSTSISSILNNISLPAFRNFTIDSASVTSGGLGVYVTEKSQIPRTYVTDKDVLLISGTRIPGEEQIQSGIISISDNVAPVILRAELLTSGTEHDSLVVYFSEPVDSINSTRPYRFNTDENKEYQVLLNAGKTINDLHASSVKQVEKNFSIKPGDSIWINTAASITDTLGNTQRNPANRRVVVVVKQMPYRLIPEAVNNPFKPGADIPGAVKRAYEVVGRGGELSSEDGGVVIVVRPVKPLQAHVKLSGKVSIFDVVKNTVLENEQMVFDQEKKLLLYVWNGRNSKGRKVATGTYLAFMDMRDNADYVEIRSIPIGVKR